MTEPSHGDDVHAFVRKVESIALFALSEDERAALIALPMQIARIDAYQDIVRERDRPSRCFALLDGFASAKSWPTMFPAMCPTFRACT